MAAPNASNEAYPRPDFVRSDLHWESLNGPWDFLFDDGDQGLLDFWQHGGLPAQASLLGTSESSSAKRTIQVPYVFQTPASGIDERGVHEVLWYERQIHDIRTREERERGHRLILRCGAVDYEATVWLDGHLVGSHRGGHVPFDLDLSEAVQLSGSTGQHRLTIRVYDSAFDLTQPRGKQFWGPQSEGIFYTPSSGIWQSVWLESVPTLRIADSSHGTIIRSNDIGRGIIDARIAVQGRRAQQKCSIEIEASIGGVVVAVSGKKALPREEAFVRFDHGMRLDERQLQQLSRELTNDAPLTDSDCWRDGVALWSPEHPLLYDLTIRLHDDSTGTWIDEVHTTTGMRSLNWTIGDGTFRLNGRPYFQALFLDQGYWPGTLMTPPSSDALKQDIVISKAMGFNGCRKHQKVEDSRFMYWADRLGFLVWGEMASCYNFSMDAVDRFNQEWMEMVRRDINHPCIVTWTPVNESWGYSDLGGDVRQRDHIRSLYYNTKTLDPTRAINDNCGWEHIVTDISSFHDYADANGMDERCVSLRSIFERGRNMWLGPIYHPDGTHDEGSKHQRGAPIMCTEFGGVNVAVENDHSRKGNWGYTTASSSQDLLKRTDEIIMAVVKEGHVCGVVWTQLTDIEQEMNGLYSYDRKPKVSPQEMAKVIERVKQAYLGQLEKRH